MTYSELVHEFLKILAENDKEIQSISSYGKNSLSLIRKFVVDAGGPKDSKYYKNHAGWVYVAFSQSIIGKKTSIKYKLWNIHHSEYSHSVEDSIVYYLQKKIQEWKRTFKLAKSIMLKKYMPAYGKWIKLLHDSSEIQRVMQVELEKLNKKYSLSNDYVNFQIERNRIREKYKKITDSISIKTSNELEKRNAAVQETNELLNSFIFSPNEYMFEKSNIIINKSSYYLAPGSSDKITINYSLSPPNRTFDKLTIEFMDKNNQKLYSKKLSKCKGLDNIFQWNGTKKGVPILFPQNSPFTFKISGIYKKHEVSTYGRFEVKIEEIRMHLPEIEGSRPNSWYKPYDLPADLGTDKYSSEHCSTSLIVYVNVKRSDGGLAPAPSGTKIKLEYEQHSGDEPKEGTGLFLNPTDNSVINDNDEDGQIRIVYGIGYVIVVADPLAVRWNVVKDKWSSTHRIQNLEPHSFKIVASAPYIRYFRFHTPKITVVEGKPKSVWFLNPKNKDLWHSSFGKCKGDVISGMINSKNQRIEIGTLWWNRVIPKTKAIYFAIYVTDIFQNPIQMNVVKPNKKNVYVMSAKAVHTMQSVVLGKGFFFRNDLRSSENEISPSIESHYPQGILSCYWKPSGTIIDGQDTLQFTVEQRNNNEILVIRDEIIQISANKNLEKIQKWFLEGEADGWYILVDLGVGLIPFVGDAKELLTYGYRNIIGKEMTKWDHAIALLSLGGLVVDTLTIASAGMLLPFTALVKGLKSIFKFVKTIARQVKGISKVMDMISDLVIRTLNPLFNTDIQDLDEIRLAPIMTLIDKIKPFSEKVWNLIKEREIEKLQKLLQILGLVTFGAQIFEFLFVLFRNHSVDDVIDILQYLIDGPGPERIN